MRLSSSCLDAPIRRGPPAPGVHRAGTFSLFLLPGGHPWRFIPKLDLAAEELEGSMSLGAREEEWHRRKKVRGRRFRGGCI
jgi:hypothetical protein